MSQSQDDYAPKNQNTAQLDSGHDTEPADPDNPDHPTRRGLPLAPSSVKPNSLPDPFVSEKGEVVSVAEAGEMYQRVQLSNLDESTLTSKYERHKCEIYPRILEADRHFRAKFNDVTTAMLTRRLSPLDDADRWLTPWECNEMLHGGKVHRSVRRALNYQLDAFSFEWVAVTAPTRSAGTPHEHIYIWIDDSDNSITIDNIFPARAKHLKHCTNAYEKHHRYRADGTGGAITLQHDPEIIDHVPNEFFSIAENSRTYTETGKVLPNTRGAQYLASQLAHLPLGDYYAKDRQDPPQALFEGAALAWASPYNWFRASNGVPS
jgi:hypothetical protein